MYCYLFIIIIIYYYYRLLSISIIIYIIIFRCFILLHVVETCNSNVFGSLLTITNLDAL